MSFAERWPKQQARGSGGNEMGKEKKPTYGFISKVAAVGGSLSLPGSLKSAQTVSRFICLKHGRQERLSSYPVPPLVEGCLSYVNSVLLGMWVKQAPIASSINGAESQELCISHCGKKQVNLVLEPKGLQQH